MVTEKIAALSQLPLGQTVYTVQAYITAPVNSCKGVIHGVDPGATSEHLMQHLTTFGPTIIAARIMGRKETAIITFEGSIGSIGPTTPIDRSRNKKIRRTKESFVQPIKLRNTIIPPHQQPARAWGALNQAPPPHQGPNYVHAFPALPPQGQLSQPWQGQPPRQDEHRNAFSQPWQGQPSRQDKHRNTPLYAPPPPPITSADAITHDPQRSGKPPNPDRQVSQALQLPLNNPKPPLSTRFHHTGPRTAQRAVRHHVGKQPGEPN
ncbi:hypothetical protein HPB47_013505 [Ixodes persulcatus]|uniref:Uncharacterized protein n=1 Tax=Ixodes persulcatus TaxID=34615 RepID=A0AC60QZB9_IXOPE|nr:hypothetical protein HPB47_013505 [Ixodes persulcatus]